MRIPTLLMLGVLGVAGCRSLAGPVATTGRWVGNGPVRITLDQRDYARTDSPHLMIRATITNAAAGRDFYSKVGDAYDSAREQSLLFAALNSHAVIERQVSATSWEVASVGHLVEGSRFVLLRAGASYRMEGDIAAQPGFYRIRLDYSDTDGDPSPRLPFRETSEVFRVR